MARLTLELLIARVRELTAAGTADYSDDAIQAVLDRNRLDFADERLTPLPQNDVGVVRYYRYQSAHRNLESPDGSDVLVLRDAEYAALAAFLDYGIETLTGRVTFPMDTAGSAYYLTGRSFDLYGAAAEVWRMKAASVAERMDFAADGASFKASQIVKQCTEMAEMYGSLATFGAGAAGLRSSTMVRDDLAPDVWR